MVVNTYDTLEIDTIHIGTILNTEERYIPAAIKIIREISMEEYLTILARTEFAYTIPNFIPHPDLKFYEVEHLPD